MFLNVINAIKQRQEHFYNFSSSVLIKVISFAFYFLSIPFFISYQGNEAYGVIAFILAILGYSVLLDNGITYTINLRYARALARGEPDPERVISQAAPLYGGLAISSIVVFYLFSAEISSSIWGGEEYSSEIAWLGVVLAIQVVAAVLDCVLRANNKITLLNVSRLVLDLVRILGIFFAAFSDNPMGVAVLLFGLAALSKILLDIYFCSRVIGLNKIVVEWSPSTLANIIKAAPVIFSISVLSLVALMYDKWFVSASYSSESYAYYSLANDFCTKAFFLFYALSGSVYTPLIKKSATQSSVKIIYKIYFIALMIMGLFYYLPLGLWSHEIFSWYVGQDFAVHAAPLVKIMACSSMLYLLFNTVETNFYARGMAHLVLLSYIVGIITLVLSLNFVFLDYGVLGASYSVLMMYFVMLIAISIAFFVDRGSIQS